MMESVFFDGQRCSAGAGSTIAARSRNRVKLAVGVRRCDHAGMALALVLLLGLFPACASEEASGADIVLRIVGEEIAYSAFERYVQRSVDGDEGALDDRVMSRLFDRFLEEQLLLRLAEERGLLEEDVEPADAMRFLLRGVAEQTWDEDEVERYYQANLARYRRPEEVHLRQILVQEQAAAQQAARALAAGEDFTAVAARLSEEPNAAQGGDQGRLSRDDLPPAFAGIIFSLAPGEVSGIVAADYGHHIFQVVAIYPAETTPRAIVEADIQQALRQEHVDQRVEAFLLEALERYSVQIFHANLPFDYRGTYASHRSE